MGLEEFFIFLDSPTQAFFPGQEVSGRVHIKLSGDKKMNRLKLEIIGKGRVEWRERDKPGPNRRGVGHVNQRVDEHGETLHYIANEDYLDMETTISHEPVLASGSHTFPFKFLLPPQLPSSFEGTVIRGTGYVRYYVKATIVRDWKFDHRVKQFFTVNAILDLNTIPSAKEPARASAHKTLCCLCCKSGPISAQINVSRIGYVSGEVINFQAEVDNQSDRQMDGSYLDLVEVVTFTAVGKTKTDQRVVSNIRRGPIGPGEQDMWEDGQMRVPALPPTELGRGCFIISVQYFLEFHVDPSGMSFDLVVTIPITIGTLPLVESIPYLAPPASDFMAPNQQQYSGAQTGWNSTWQPSAPPTEFSSYPSLPPPTFAESVFGVTDMKDEDENEYTGGNFNFAPRYVTYTTQY